MSGSYYSDKEIIELFTQVTLGGHSPDKESLDIIKSMNEDFTQDVASLLASWLKAFKEKRL